MGKTVLIVALIVICATAAFAQGGPPPGGPKGGPGGPPPICSTMAILPPPAAAVDAITKALGLTTQQAADLKTVLTASGDTLGPLVKTASDATKALRDAVFAATYDADAVAAAVTAAQDAEVAIVTASIDTWAKIRAILTADQFAKLAAGPGPGGPRPPGPPPPRGGGSTAPGGRR